jgi:hypothetical protein
MKNLASSIFLITVLGLSTSCFAPLHADVGADEETSPQENFYKKLLLRNGDVINNLDDQMDDQPVSDPQQVFQMLDLLRHRDTQISRDQEPDADQNPAQLEESQSSD